MRETPTVAEHVTKNKPRFKEFRSDDSMLQIVARAFYNGQLVGYVLTDGVEKQVVSKRDTWLYARNNQILNVKAIDNVDKATLTGTNGFRLKELPEVKIDENIEQPKAKVSKTDIDAAYMRYVIRTADIQAVEAGRVYYDSDIREGILKKQNDKILSKYLLVESELYKDIAQASTGRAFIGLLGYKIKNTSNQSIPIIRIESTPNHNKTTVELAPGNSICLNLMEIAVLASKPEVSEQFANGELHYKGMARQHAKTLYNWLEAHSIKSKPNNKFPKEKVTDVVSPAEVERYFKK